MPNELEQIIRLHSRETSDFQLIFIVPDKTMTDLASWVSELSLSSKSLLPKTEAEVTKMFSEKRSIVLLDSEGFPVAHSAITYVYAEQNVVELGGVIVAPHVRRKGYGTLAAQAAVKLAGSQYPGWTKLVLCNAASLPIFLGLGGQIVTHEQVSMVPVEAWEACKTCPKYAETKALGKICCDTPVIMP